MIITDTHTHLYDEQFQQDIDEVIQNAMDKGVQRFFLPAIDDSSMNTMRALKKKYPYNIFLMTGLHPCSVNENWISQCQYVEDTLEENIYCAIGEIGIDLYWSKKFEREQKQAFQKQIQIAKDKNLPIAIHCRNAFDEIIDILQKEKTNKLKCVFHCFTGNLNQAKQLISLGIFLGIGGVVTFKNTKLKEVLTQVPIKNIVIETDAPYLAPTPYRGRRNEPKYLTEVIKTLCHVYQLSLEEIARITTENSEILFNL